jgi:putative ABC transport system permease protein
MIRAALRDLQFRRRRFAIATLGAGLVFGLGITMSGLAAGFDREVERTVAIADADQWIVADSSAGPFAGTTRLPQDAVDQIAAIPGVTDAGGFIFTPMNVGDPESPELVNMFGVEPGHVGAPAALRGTNDAVIDENLDLSIGETLELSGRAFTVVDIVRSSMFAGVPNVYIDLGAAQELGFAGGPIVSTILIDGDAGPLPGLRSMSNREVEENALLNLGDAATTIGLVRTILWLVAALVIGSVLYLNAQERTRDFAVFKATGSTTASIVAGLAVQATAIAAVASVLAIVIGRFLGPVMPMAVETPFSTYLLTPLVVLIVSLLGSIAGARRAASVPPAVAFGG